MGRIRTVLPSDTERAACALASAADSTVSRLALSTTRRCLQCTLAAGCRPRPCDRSTSASTPSSCASSAPTCSRRSRTSRSAFDPGFPISHVRAPRNCCDLVSLPRVLLFPWERVDYNRMLQHILCAALLRSILMNYLSCIDCQKPNPLWSLGWLFILPILHPF